MKNIYYALILFLGLKSNSYWIAASTSSVASSMTARNSPKEKRQANSPLPKPPDVLLPDDMYAKVLKKQRKGETDWCNSRDSLYSTDPEPAASSHNFQAGPSNAAEPNASTKPAMEFEYLEGNKAEEHPDRYACGYEVLPERKYV